MQQWDFQGAVGAYFCVQYSPNTRTWRGAISHQNARGAYTTIQGGMWVSIDEITEWLRFHQDSGLLHDRDIPTDMLNLMFGSVASCPTTVAVKANEWKCRGQYNIHSVCGAMNEVGYPCYRCGQPQ